MTAYVWLNGALRTAAEPMLGAGERGFLYGDGLFETMRLVRGRPFALADHLRRLRNGAATLRIPVPYTDEELGRAAAAVAGACRLAEGALRITLARGPAAGSYDRLDGANPTLLIAVRPLASAAGAVARAVTARWRRNPTSPLVSMKTLNYLENVLARAEARTAGAEEALFLNTAGEWTEGTSSNLFVVSGDRVQTPPVEAGLLPGITRAAVLRLGRDLGFTTTETPLPADALRSSEEAFLTGSLRGLVPLVSLDGRPIGAGEPGPVTSALAAAYERLAAGGD